MKSGLTKIRNRTSARIVHSPDEARVELLRRVVEAAVFRMGRVIIRDVVFRVNDDDKARTRSRLYRSGTGRSCRHRGRLVIAGLGLLDTA